MVKCIAKTADGHKCRANAMVGSEYCHAHIGGRVGKPRVRVVSRSLHTNRRTRRKGAARKSAKRSPLRYTRRRRSLYVTKKINKGSCRPKTKLGRPSRKLPNDMVIPTVREYANQFPAEERARRVQEYMMMDGCELAKLAVHKEYAKKSH